MTRDLEKGTHGIERIVLHDCEEFDEGTNEKFQFVRALRNHYVGIFLKGAPRGVRSCVKDMVEEHHDVMNPLKMLQNARRNPQLI